MAPSLGLLLNAEYPTSELVELGRLSEALGYRFFWYTDVRFARECYLGLAAVAGATHHITLGPGVTDPYSRHPAITAATIATLDEISGGRALLGLGTGGSGFRELGIGKPLPVAALRETVDVVRGLLRGEEITQAGKVISISGGRLAFTPPRTHVPIYFATHGAQVTKLAGRVADGVLLANTLVPEAIDFYVHQIRDGLASVGRAPESFDFGLRVEACIADDHDAAFSVMRRRMATRLMSQYPHWDYLKYLGLTLPPAFVEIAARKDPRLADEATAALPDEVVTSTVLAGNPERVAAQIAQVMRPEISQLTIRPHHIAGQRAADVVRAFAQEVVTRLT